MSTHARIFCCLLILAALAGQVLRVLHQTDTATVEQLR